MSFYVFKKAFPKANLCQFVYEDCIYIVYIKWKVNGEKIMFYGKRDKKIIWVGNIKPEMKKQLCEDLGLDNGRKNLAKVGVYTFYS